VDPNAIWDFRPTCGRLWPSLDCASLGHRHGRDHPRAAATLRIISGAEIVKENDSLTHERDKCGHDCKCQVAAPIVPLSVHLPISPILDDTNNVGIAASAIQLIVFAVPIEKIDQTSCVDRRRPPRSGRTFSKIS
jgi:hypothetical protein